LVGILFLLVQTGFLILGFLMIKDIEDHVLIILSWLSEYGVGLTATNSGSGNQTQTEPPQSGAGFPRDYIIQVR